jgi:hypothetical protein
MNKAEYGKWRSGGRRRELFRHHDHVTVIMTSAHKPALTLEADDRRFIILEPAKRNGRPMKAAR